MSQENFWIPKHESIKNMQNEINEAEKDRVGPISTPEHLEDTLNIPQGLVPTKEIFERKGFSLEEIHDWYAKAMIRRFDRTPLSLDNFIHHFEHGSTDPTFAFGNKDDGYALGYVRHGIFIPTHFAPKTTRGGYRLMQSLGKSLEIPAVLSITEDLVDTLKKMPEWHTVDIELTSMFRDQLMDKFIVYNSHPDVERLMLELIKDYMTEMGSKHDEVKS